jgi:hypothetical protein
MFYGKGVSQNMEIKPGQSTTLTATPLDASGIVTSLPPGDVPTWASSNPEAKITESADGLSLRVDIDPLALPGDVAFTITDAVNPAATGTITLTIVTPAPNPVASFRVDASAPV